MAPLKTASHMLWEIHLRAPAIAATTSMSVDMKASNQAVSSLLKPNVRVIAMGLDSGTAA
jgi:hypothetical protein